MIASLGSWLGSVSGIVLLERIGWALVHSLWQIAVVALCYRLTWLVFESPRWRHATGMSCLVIALLWPIWSAIDTPTPRAATVLEVEAGLSPVGGVGEGEDQARGWTPTALFELTDWSRLRPTLPWLAAGWMMGVVLMSLRLGCGAVWTRRLRQRSTDPVPADLARRVRELAARVNLRRPIEVLVGARLQVPCVLGALRPALVLPLSTLTGLSPAQLDAVILHELAHVRRHDLAWSLVQSVIDALLFYHPAAGWMSKQIREQRELCCDDLVVALTGQPHQYAGALATLERLRVPRWTTAASGGDLRRRVARILGQEETTMTRSTAIPLTLALLVATLGVLTWPSFAAEEKEGAQVLNVETRLMLVEADTVERLTVSWSPRPKGATEGRHGTAEAATLFAELDRPETEVLSAPRMMTLSGEAATIQSGLEGGGRLEITIVPEALRGQVRLAVDTRLHDDGEGGDGAETMAAVSGLILAPGRVLVQAEPMTLPGVSTGRSGEAGLRSSRTLLVVTSAELAAEVAIEPGEASLGELEPVSLSLRDASIEEVVSSFAGEFGFDYRFDPSARALLPSPVSGRLDETPWREALDVMLTLSGMTAETDEEGVLVIEAVPVTRARQE